MSIIYNVCGSYSTDDDSIVDVTEAVDGVSESYVTATAWRLAWIAAWRRHQQLVLQCINTVLGKLLYQQKKERCTYTLTVEKYYFLNNNSICCSLLASVSPIDHSREKQKIHLFFLSCPPHPPLYCYEIVDEIVVELYSARNVSKNYFLSLNCSSMWIRRMF